MVPGLVIVGTGLIGCESNERARANVNERDRTARAQDRSARAQADRERGRTLGTMAESFAASSSMAFPTGDPSTSSVLVEKALPREVLVGQEFEYRIRVTNLTDQPIMGVRVREFSESPQVAGGNMQGQPLSTRRTFGIEQPSRSGQNQPGGRVPDGIVADERDEDLADLGANPDRLGDEGVAAPDGVRPPMDQPRTFGIQEQPYAQDAMMGGGDFREYYIDRLEPGETRTITATAVARDPGIAQLCSTVIYQPVLCSTTMVIAPELQVTKTGPQVASVCEPLTYTITVTNTGVGPAEGVVLTESLPEGFTTPDARAGELTFDVGTLEAGESREFTVTARGETAGEFTNRTVARSARGLTAEAQTTTQLVEPQLEIEKLGPAEAFTGVPMEFVINVRNVGDIPVRNLRIEDAAPQGAVFVAATQNGRFADGRTTWQLDTLNPGDSRTFAVRLENNAPGVFENCVRILTDCGQPVTDCVTVTLESITGLRLLIVDTDDPIAIGDDELYTIQVKNQGGAEATNVQVAINLPPEFTMVSATGPQGANARPQAGEQPGIFVFEPIPTLAPGQTVEWRVIARGEQATDARVGARLSADQLSRPVIANESTRIFDPTPARPVAPPADQPPAPNGGQPGTQPPPGGQIPTPPPGTPATPDVPDDSGMNDPLDDSPADTPGETEPR